MKNFKTVIIEILHFAFDTHSSRAFIANFALSLFLCWNMIMLIAILVVLNIVGNMPDLNPAICC